MTFREGWIEAGGFRIRTLEAGDGPPLVCLHGAGGLRINRAHELLSLRCRVIAFEMPGFGTAENTRTASIRDLAATMSEACAVLGLTRFHLMGTSFGAKVALWLAIGQPERIHALVLEAPAAIRPAGSQPASGSPEAVARLLYAHPERIPPGVPTEPAAAARMIALTKRLRGPDRDPELEAAMRTVPVPALIVMGTRDQLIPDSLGRIYKQVMPDAHLVFVYDAGHAISAERPEAFVDVVGDFLERKETFVISRASTVILP